MSDRLLELAERIRRRACNAPGTDKTWVLNAMWAHLQFRAEVARAKRVDES